MALIELDFFPDSPSAVVGELVTGQTVNIELWEDGTLISISSSGCTEINSTGWYSWSTGGISVLTSSVQQFHWRMSDSGLNTDEGDFLLMAHEGRDGVMPSLNNQSSYINQI